MAAHGGSNVFVGGRSFGTSFHSKHWLSLDPCGLAGVSCSWFVHIYALIVIAIKLLSNSLVAMVVYLGLYVPASILAMTALFQAWTTNPGAVPLGARPLTIVRRASSDLGGSAGGGSNHGTNNNNGTNGAAAAAAMGTEASSSLRDKTASSASSPLPPRAIRRCHKCNDNYKPPRAHHDSVTGRCIVKFDHFCPWVGNAVGALNHKFFCLFLLYTSITCSLSLFLLILRVVHCGYRIDKAVQDEENNNNVSPPAGSTSGGGGEQLLANSGYVENREEIDGDGLHHHYHYQERFLSVWDYDDAEQQHRHLLEYKYPECEYFYSHAVLILTICSLVFLVFTCSMGCEQLEAIETGKGKIARMKMRVGTAGTEFQRVTEEFNEMFGGDSPQMSWHWFDPTRSVQFPRGMKKVVLGYEWDESFDPEPYEPGANGSLVVGDDDDPLHHRPSTALGDREMDELELGRRKNGGGSGIMNGNNSNHSNNSKNDKKKKKAPPPGAINRLSLPSHADEPADVLLSRDSSHSDVSSVTSDTPGGAAASGIKNRKSPPKAQE